MLRITGDRGCGKTVQLLYYAAENEAIFVCPGNVGYAKYLAERLQIPNREKIQFITYSELNNISRGSNRKIVIDEIDSFIKFNFGNNIIPYTIGAE